MNFSETYQNVLKDLANTMLGVSRESVALMKRSDQQGSMKLNRTQEWEVYLEFLRVQFNLVDRLSAFYIPIQDQPEFMNSLEDSVTEELKTVLAPTMSSAELDEMEVTLAVGKTVAESRQIFERYKFIVTEHSKERDEFFQAFSTRVAAKMQSAGNEKLTSAAFLCASSVVPALTQLFEDLTASPADRASSEPAAAEAAPATANASTDVTNDAASPAAGEHGTASQRITLVRIMSKMSGEAVETWWGVHPQFQRDLQPQEAKDLATHMNRVTRIVGERFAVVASLAQAGGDQPVGHA